MNAQTTSLTLSPAKAESGGTATLELLLHSSTARPAALQWTFQYLPSDISSIGVDDGPMITSAGKTVLCTGGVPACKCLVVGANANLIADGVVARVTAVLSPGVKETTIALRDALGASADGNGIPISTVSGSITSSMSPLDESSPETRSRKRHPPRKPETPMKGQSDAL